MSWIDSLPPEDKVAVLDYIEQQSDSVSSSLLFPEYRAVRPDGTERWIEARGIPILGEAGEVVRVAGVAVDITARKSAEHDQERLARSLEDALGELSDLRSIIPVCAYCKSIRDDEGAWDDLLAYVAKHSHGKLSHGVCPACLRKAKSDAGLD